MAFFPILIAIFIIFAGHIFKTASWNDRGIEFWQRLKTELEGKGAATIQDVITVVTIRNIQQTRSSATALKKTKIEPQIAATDPCDADLGAASTEPYLDESITKSLPVDSPEVTVCENTAYPPLIFGMSSSEETHMVPATTIKGSKTHEESNTWLPLTPD